MALFDFIKKILGTKVESEVRGENVLFDDLQGLVKDKQLSLDAAAQNAHSVFREELLALTIQLDKKLPLLAAVDFEKIKADDRAKFVVKANLNLYIGFVNRLQQDISDLAFTSLDAYTTRMEKYFFDFMKQSNVSFDKTQYLVGKELVVIKDLLVEFYKRQKNFRENNQEIITTTHLLAAVQKKLDKINQIENSSKEILAKIKSTERARKLLKEKLREVTKNLKDVEEGEEYAQNLEKEKELTIAKARLKNEYDNLKRMIDFKALATAFHTSQKYMDLVKAHRDDFVSTIETDGGMKLQSLLREAHLYNLTISSKISQIKDMKKDFLDKEADLQEDMLAPLLLAIQKAEFDLSTAQKQKGQESAMYDKLLTAKKDIMNSIRDELSDINVVLVLDDEN